MSQLSHLLSRWPGTTQFKNNLTQAHANSYYDLIRSRFTRLLLIVSRDDNVGLYNDDPTQFACTHTHTSNPNTTTCVDTTFVNLFQHLSISRYFCQPPDTFVNLPKLLSTFFNICQPPATFVNLLQHLSTSREVCQPKKTTFLLGSTNNLLGCTLTNSQTLTNTF